MSETDDMLDDILATVGVKRSDLEKEAAKNRADIEKLPDGPFKTLALAEHDEAFEAVKPKGNGKMAKTADLQRAKMQAFVRGMQKGSSVTGTGNKVAGQEDTPTRARWR